MSLGRFLWEDLKTVMISLAGVGLTVAAIVIDAGYLIALGAVLAIFGAVKLRLDWPKAQRGDMHTLT